jgi:hypothetical protein
VTGTARVTAVHPRRAIEGGRVTIFGSDFRVDQPLLPDVRVGNLRARVVYASPTRIAALVPPGITESGRVPVSVAGLAGDVAFLEVAAPFATGLQNYVLEGAMKVILDDHEVTLEKGDSLFFNSGLKHAMVALKGKPAKFLAIIL